MPSKIISKVGLIERAILHRAKITFTPTTSNGQFLGPGYAGQIDFQVSSGQFVGDTEDIGDGTYVRAVEYLPGEKPVISVSVHGEQSDPFPVDHECRICGLIKRLCGKYSS